MNLSKNEELIIETLRKLNPFEQVIITADKTGKPDNYLLVKSSKILLTVEGQMFMR
jgi:hypothetical protein